MAVHRYNVLLQVRWASSRRQRELAVNVKVTFEMTTPLEVPPLEQPVHSPQKPLVTELSHLASALTFDAISKNN